MLSIKNRPLRSGQAPSQALEKSTSVTTWIYGAGTFCRDVAAALQAQGVEVAGFIEMQPRQPSAWGYPVRALVDCCSNLLNQKVLVAVFNRLHPLSKIRQDLLDLGFDHVLMPWDYYGQLADQLGWRYWLEDSQFLRQHQDQLAHVLSKLADPISRQCLTDVTAFRSGENLAYSAQRHSLPQYFNELTLPHLPKVTHYVDGGAYDGDTYLHLANQLDVGQAWLFEPDPSNFSMLRRNLPADIDVSVHLLPLALSERHERLAFSDGGGEASCVSASGSVGITAVALDDVVGKSAVNFIKLDVEGGERAALLGAKVTIQREAPILALSAYHRPTDLWDLINTIDQFDCGYRYWLRQHPFNSFDLVLYAIRSPGTC
jgi:FkbM family methyltransferase